MKYIFAIASNNLTEFKYSCVNVHEGYDEKYGGELYETMKKFVGDRTNWKRLISLGPQLTLSIFVDITFTNIGDNEGPQTGIFKDNKILYEDGCVVFYMCSSGCMSHKEKLGRGYALFQGPSQSDKGIILTNFKLNVTTRIV